MKFTTTAFCLFTTAGFFAAVTAECDESKDVCVKEGGVCSPDVDTNECCGELECFGFPFFKKCQPLPECIPEWQVCVPGVGGAVPAIPCCGDTKVCALQYPDVPGSNTFVCTEETVDTITTRTVDITASITDKTTASPTASPSPKDPRTTPNTGEFNYGCVTGDPHITTFDGLKWDCMGHGEHVILKSTVSGRQVQGRFAQLTDLQDYKLDGDGNVVLENANDDVYRAKWSINKGIVIQDQGVSPTVQITFPEVSQAEGGGVSQILTNKRENDCRVQFFVDGVQKDLYQGSGTDDVEVTVTQGKTVRIFYPATEFEVTVSMGFWHGCLLNACFKVPASDQVTGLMGIPDGDISNDWATIDGTPIPVPESPYDLRTKKAYDHCQANYCIRDEATSLFTYNQVGYNFEDFELCDLPFNTFLAEHIEDKITPEIAGYCGTDMDCIVDAVTGGLEAAAEAVQTRTAALQNTCNGEGGECDSGKCCDGFTCISLGGLSGKTCHADTAAPACYPELAQCDDTKPCCEDLTCEERNNGLSFCKAPSPPCAAERSLCTADSDCCGDFECAGPAGNKRCLALVKQDSTKFLPDGETCSYANQEYQCLPDSKCVLTADGNICTKLPTCWNAPYRPCGDNFGYPGCCEESGNTCQWDNGRQLCVPTPTCQERLFSCDNDNSCCGDLECEFRGARRVCVEPLADGCTNDKSGGGKDTGCSDEQPICVTNAERSPADQQAGTSCEYCLNTAEGDNVDVGCTSDAPICVQGDFTEPDQNKAGQQCVEGGNPDNNCVNNAWSGVNTGCTSDKPICFRANLWRPQIGGSGSHCGLCQNDKTGDAVDQGCTYEFPRCVHDDGSETQPWRQGGQCVEPLVQRCRNTGYANLGAIDHACDANKPICSKQDGYTASQNAVGDYCTVCKNTESDSAKIDRGCTAEKPNCLNNNGGKLPMWKTGPKCGKESAISWCQNDTWGRKDKGCTEPGKPVCSHENNWAPYPFKKTGTKCMKCKNTKFGDDAGKTDIGCTNDKPNCVAANGGNLPNWKNGDKCVA